MKKKSKPYLIIAAIIILSILFAFVAPALDFLFWLFVYVGIMGSAYTSKGMKIFLLIFPILACVFGIYGYYYANKVLESQFWISMSVVVVGCSACCEFSGVILFIRQMYLERKGKKK